MVFFSPLFQTFHQKSNHIHVLVGVDNRPNHCLGHEDNCSGFYSHKGIIILGYYLILIFLDYYYTLCAACKYSTMELHL